MRNLQGECILSKMFNHGSGGKDWGECCRFYFGKSCLACHVGLHWRKRTQRTRRWFGSMVSSSSAIDPNLVWTMLQLHLAGLRSPNWFCLYLRFITVKPDYWLRGHSTLSECFRWGCCVRLIASALFSCYTDIVLSWSGSQTFSEKEPNKSAQFPV